MSLGVAFDGRNPLPALREQAQAAESAGADAIWVSSHLFLRDPFTMAASVLDATTRVRVTLMAVSPHVIHPVHIAMGAATLDELAPGRVVLSAASSVEFVHASLEHVARGATGRGVRRAGLVYAAVADHEADALGRFRRQLAITLRAPHHATNVALAGAALDQEAVRRAVAREDWAAAERLVGDDVVRRHTASGT